VFLDVLIHYHFGSKRQTSNTRAIVGTVDYLAFVDRIVEATHAAGE